MTQEERPHVRTEPGMRFGEPHIKGIPVDVTPDPLRVLPVSNIEQPDDDFDPEWADNEMWVFRYDVIDFVFDTIEHHEIHERRAEQRYPILRARQLAEEHGVPVHFTSARTTANYNFHWRREWPSRSGPFPVLMPYWHVVYPTGGPPGWKVGRYTVVDCPNRADHGLPPEVD